jgi:hypothetical protein
MKHRLSLFTLGLAIIGACASTQAVAQAAAQEAAATATPASAPAAEATAVVEVSSVKNPQFKPYRQMLKGLDAYNAHRALAPQAPLQFLLVTDGGKAALTDVTLRIAGENTSFPLALAKDGTFTFERIQAAIDDNADMVSNKRRGLLHWRPNIHTPNVPADARRLGDLRLECEMSWAVTKDDLSFLKRNGIELLGGLCHSSQVMLHYEAPRELASATLVSGERRQTLVIDEKNHRVFSPPLSDATWNDDALVLYEFAAPAP